MNNHSRTRLIGSLILLCQLTFCGNLVYAEILPQPFKATYKARYSGFDITAERSLQALADGNYALQFNARSWVANIDEQSNFRWGEHGYLIPGEYTYERKVLGKTRQAHLLFDWPNKQVTNAVQDSTWRMQLPDIALDKLGYQLQLRKDLINKRELGPYSIADGGRLKTYEFAVLGKALIETPLGKFNAVHVQRIRKNNKRATHIWLAEDWDYLIVKLQQIEKGGKAYEINLSSATLGEQVVTGL